MSERIYIIYPSYPPFSFLFLFSPSSPFFRANLDVFLFDFQFDRFFLLFLPFFPPPLLRAAPPPRQKNPGWVVGSKSPPCCLAAVIFRLFCFGKERKGEIVPERGDVEANACNRL